jgi:hypothetical protein
MTDLDPAPTGPPPSSARIRGLIPWLAPVALWCAMAGLFMARLAGWAPDDFYITYRYAHNLAQGSGFVFNPGERVFGSTDPGLGLLLGALQALTRAPVPWVASAVFAASLIGIALLVLIAARRRGHGIEAVLGGTLLLAAPYFWANQGAAMPLALFLLLLAAALSPRSLTAAGLLAGAAVWVRPDTALGVALLALLLLWEERRVPWRYVLAAGAVIAAGIGLAWAYYGSPLPNTLGAKTEMAAATPGSWSGLRFWLRAYVPISRHFGAEWPAVLIAGLAGCGFLAARAGRSGRLLALFGLAIALAYPLLRVPFFSWYILPCLLAAVYGVAFFAGAAGRALAARAPAVARMQPLLTAGIFLALAFSTLRLGWAYARGFTPAPYLQSYQRGAEWIRASSPPDAGIAYVEIGVLGYYSERPILDLMGLVSPWVRPYVVQQDLLGAFKARPTEFVLFHTRGRMAPIVRARWFRRRYEEVMQFADPGDRGSLHIFRRRAAIVQPEPSSAAPL